MIIDTDNIVSSSQIAMLLGVAPSAVSNWKRRHKDTFPKPIYTVSQSRGPQITLYDKVKIMEWYEDHFGPITVDHLDTEIARLEAMREEIKERESNSGIA